MSKKTREQKLKANIRRIKQFDDNVKSVVNINNITPFLTAQTNISPVDNSVNKSNEEKKYISKSIKKSVFIGSLMFIGIIILFIVNLKYNFINPLGKDLFDFLLKR